MRTQMQINHYNKTDRDVHLGIHYMDVSLSLLCVDGIFGRNTCLAENPISQDRATCAKSSYKNLFKMQRKNLSIFYPVVIASPSSYILKYLRIQSQQKAAFHIFTVQAFIF